MNLILVLGDQLTPDLSALRAADTSRDVVDMAEVMGGGTYVLHHPQKIILILAAMRKFAATLRDQGWQVAYSRLDDPANPRMAQMYRTWDRMEDDHKSRVLADAGAFLTRMEAGEMV